MQKCCNEINQIKAYSSDYRLSDRVKYCASQVALFKRIFHHLKVNDVTLQRKDI